MQKEDCSISEREKTPSINRNPSSPREREEVSDHRVFTAIWKEDIIKETSEARSLRAQKASKSSSNVSVGQAERQHIHPGASELSISLLPLQGENYDLTNRKEEKKAFRRNTPGEFPPDWLNWWNGVHQQSLSQSIPDQQAWKIHSLQ